MLLCVPSGCLICGVSVVSSEPSTEHSASFHVATALDEEVATIRLAGEFDIAGIGAAHDALSGALAADRPRLVVDLSGLSFIDSSGLRFVIAARAACEDAGRVYSLRRGEPAVQRIFELTRLESQLPFED